MRVTVVGCAGSFPTAASPASCYLVEHEGFRLVLDLGNGALGALQTYAPLDGIDAIVLSHLHADHCIDLTSYYVVRRYHPSGHLGRVPVYAPAGAAERLARAYDIDADPGLTHEFDFHDIADGSRVQVGPFVVETVLVLHPVEAYAVKVTAAGRSFVYSGDTAACQALATFAVGADLALFEASFVESATNPVDLHMTGADAGRTATEANIERLVLTHLVGWNDDAEVEADARSTFDGKLSLARPGDIYEV